MPRPPSARPTARGIGFLVAAAVGLVAAYASGWAALLAVALFLLAAVVAAWAAVLVQPASVRVDRRVDPAAIEAGGAAVVRLTVTGRTAEAEWADAVPAALQVAGTAAGRLPALGPEAPSVRFEYLVTGSRRGAVEVGRLLISRSDPLGLVVARRAVGASARVVVLPTVHPVVPPRATTRTDPDQVSAAVFGRSGEQRDVVARSYRAGDPMRSVDWRTTAHRGELMVRAESAATAMSTAIVLETRSGAWPDARSFEWAVECAASLAAELDARRAGVRLATDRLGPVATDAPTALVALALAGRRAEAARPAELVLRVRQEDVQIVHVITGAGSVDDLARLPSLSHGEVGLVSLVGADGPDPVVPVGWRVLRLDPQRAVSGAWSA